MRTIRKTIYSILTMIFKRRVKFSIINCHQVTFVTINSVCDEAICRIAITTGIHTVNSHSQCTGSSDLNYYR